MVLGNDPEIEQLKDRMKELEAENKRLKETIGEAVAVMDDEPAKAMLWKVLRGNG